MSKFSWNSVPLIRHRRSQFDLSHIVKTSGSVGTLYPFDVQEVYAGDSFKVKTNVVTRLTSTFLKPVVDNLFLDVYHFFVPSRLCQSNYGAIFGENTESAWARATEVTAAMVPTPASGTQYAIGTGTVADYMGLPIGNVDRSVKISVLPFRAFALIYDQWFRDENNIDPMHVLTSSTTNASESLNRNDWAPNNYTGNPPKVAKLHDYFTSCLPAPQKGAMSSVPVQFLTQSFLPLTTQRTIASFGSNPLNFGFSSPLSVDKFLAVGRANGTVYAADGDPVGGPDVTGSNAGVVFPGDTSLNGSITVSDLRFATQYQRMLERDARGGTRYVEYLSSAFGVSNPDARLQRSEFLGGRRIPISITQVTQSTGANSETSPLGEVGAFSLTGGKTYYNKGFTEHGYVLSVFCIRQFHTYQDGVEKFWTRQKRSDFFDPVFDHLSEQPVYNYEIYARPNTNPTHVLQPFGYNEAWADLRTRRNIITGQMRSGLQNSLDFWHFGDTYAGPPTLSKTFIEETPTYVDRTITVPSTSQDQFLLDFYIQNRAYRCLPTYSIPGLVDHG